MMLEDIKKIILLPIKVRYISTSLKILSLQIIFVYRLLSFISYN